MYGAPNSAPPPQPSPARGEGAHRRAGRELSEVLERTGACPAASRQLARLIAKLFTYSSGFAASKVLPITTKLLVVAAVGVMPAPFMSLVVSVSRNTCLATSL